MQGVNLCAAPVQAVARLTYTRLWTRQARYGDDRVSGPVAAGEWSCSDCLLMINFASCDKNKTAGFLCMWPVFQAPFYFPVVKVVVYHVRSGQCVRSRVKRGLCRWRQNKTSNKTIRVFFLFFFFSGGMSVQSATVATGRQVVPLKLWQAPPSEDNTKSQTDIDCVSRRIVEA